MGVMDDAASQLSMLEGGIMDQFSAPDKGKTDTLQRIRGNKALMVRTGSLDMSLAGLSVV